MIHLCRYQRHLAWSRQTSQQPDNSSSHLEVSNIDGATADGGIEQESAEPTSSMVSTLWSVHKIDTHLMGVTEGHSGEGRPFWQLRIFCATVCGFLCDRVRLCAVVCATVFDRARSSVRLCATVCDKHQFLCDRVRQFLSKIFVR